MPLYSLRAELPHDFDAFEKLCQEQNIDIQVKKFIDRRFPEIDVEVTTDATLDTLRSVIRKIPDGHRMMQTLDESSVRTNPRIGNVANWYQGE